MHFDNDYGDYRCMGVEPRWVGLGQLFGGLDWAWVDEMDPRTTLSCFTLHSVLAASGESNL